MHSANKIPGYTGFVPYKSDFFGQTVGVLNSKAQQVYRASFQSNSDPRKPAKTLVELQ